MSNFLFSSIGRKFMMSITGLFLLIFIAVHLTLNLFLIFDDTGALFNQGAHFMATNPAIKIMEPILALGFIVHILWSIVLTIQNMKARPVGYKKSNLAVSSTWASRNMFVLGGLVFVFLVLHIIHFYVKIKFTGDPLLSAPLAESLAHVEHMENTYALVAGLFKASALYGIVYILGAILLAVHLSHGFWSSFQTLGLNNKNWMKRLQLVGYVYAIIVGVGFAIIPLYFMIKF